MRLRTATCTLVALIGTAGSAWAAAATSEGAQAIESELARYLGSAPLKVTPSGESYTIDVDLKAALHGLEGLGVTLDPVIYSMNATPQDDGTWRVTSGSTPLITVKTKGQTTSIVANNQGFDGIFDPRIPAFTRSQSHYDSLNIGTVGTGHGKAAGTVQTRELRQGEQTLAATTGGDGVIDATLVQTNGGYAQDIAIDGEKGAQHVTIKAGPTKDTFTVAKLPIRAILDLWSFYVSHPTQPELKANGEALKAHLRRILPLFASMKQDGSFDQISVATPVGPVAARTLASHLDLTGLTEAGTADIEIKAEDLVLPNALLPAWAPALLPKGIDLHNVVTGFRLDTAANAVIDGFRPGEADPFPPEAKAKVQASLGSTDTLVMRFADNRITTPTLDIRFDGEVHMRPPIPAFSVQVHATGLDKALAAIRTTAAGDASAAQVMAVLTLVKGYGEADGADSFAWKVVGDGTGSITVNGAPLPIGDKK